MNTIFIVLPILTLLMFDLGLVLKPADFRLVATRPKPVLIGLFGQIILLPLVAWLIIRSPLTTNLSPLFIIGIMLVACSPGGSSSNVFSMSALILATTSCGALIAWLFRCSTKERRTLVIEIGMQNAAQAITIACSPLIFNNEVIAIPAIIYSLMMNIILLTYVGITKIYQ